MDNYQYCTQWALSHGGEGLKVLDYGCGAGQIVERLRAAGADVWGCDVFYEGASYQSSIAEPVRDRIKQMEGGRIPFEDRSFDLVINNQVLEHVPDLPLVLQEIDRVLRPGGRVLSLFPDAGVWREGHCGIPFLHWFPKGSHARVYYAWGLRTLGAGYHKAGKSRWQWAVDFCRWLDDWTHYRPLREIEGEFARRFSLRYIEDDWFDKRAPALAAAVPPMLKRLAVRKLGMSIVEAQKAGA